MPAHDQVRSQNAGGSIPSARKSTYSLPAMIDLVVDHVEEQIVDRECPLAERSDRLGVFLARCLRDDRIKFRRARIPCGEDLVSRGCCTLGLRRPLTGQNAVGCRYRHAEHFGGEGAEWAHPTERQGRELVSREGGNHTPREATVPLPVAEESGWRDDRGGESGADIGPLGGQEFLVTRRSLFEAGRCLSPIVAARP